MKILVEKYLDTAVEESIQLARKATGQKLEKILNKMHSRAYKELYNLDVALSDSYGKGEDAGIKKARIIVQKALDELHTVKWIKAMDLMFTGKSDLT